MSDLDLLSYYLGIEVVRNSEGISLCQKGYALKILQKTGMEDCNACQVPMEPKQKLTKSGDEPKMDVTRYKSIVGSLRYLVNTRPDLAYSVGIMSRFMESPTEAHMTAVQILRYVEGTMNLGCFYARNNDEHSGLMGYSDSDLAGDIDDRKSTTGVVFFLGSSPVTWLS